MTGETPVEKGEQPKEEKKPAKDDRDFHDGDDYDPVPNGAYVRLETAGVKIGVAADDPEGAMKLLDAALEGAGKLQTNMQ